jgi:hypothetical protein
MWIYIYIIIVIILLLLFFTCPIPKKNRNKCKCNVEKFTEPTTSTPFKEILSYWNKYVSTDDTRSKCIDCDNTSKLKHPSKCIDCEEQESKSLKYQNRYLVN